MVGGLKAQQSTNNIFENVYKFNGKELDESTGYYYYGARYYDPAISIFLSVDPLAEQFPAWNPYNYTMQNPINLTDPTGMAPEGTEYIRPYYHIYKMRGGDITTNQLPDKFQKSINDVMATKVGNSFFSNFMRKGESFGGKTADSNGKYSNIELQVWGIEDKETNGNYWATAGAEGFFRTKVDDNGDLVFSIIMDPKYGEESVGESLLNEITAHGQHVEAIINYYNENGADKTKQYLKNTKTGNSDHKALRDNDMGNKGYEQYSKGKTEMIKNNKNYNETFKNAQKKYNTNSTNYRDL
ncbi:RHS repeat domain-containing protein [Myroides indicus]|uniref:RHS repeat-associated protein n=1 Tax=Myroides indicus TaxID=1323422 RepID=A0A4R7F1U6_9FLAO|nr:RHS repeat-associated core domain-containing protein [Myroides indicus]TDS56948.1 RHS repeat-associated protein [Myroides indicus]